MTIREMIEILKEETGIEDIEDYEFGVDVNGEYWGSYYTIETKKHYDTLKHKYVYEKDSNGDYINLEFLNRYEINKEHKFITFFN